MIVKISQTASNIKQFYEIEGDDGFCFEGKNGSISRFQPISIFNQDTTIKGIHKIPKWVNFIPFRYLFGKANVRRVFNLYRNDALYGSIYLWTHGFLKSCYVIQLNNAVLHCYTRLIGSFDYVSIYINDKQIALMETYLSVSDYKYTHKLYILDEYKFLADTLSFFAVYYASYNFANRLHMSRGSVYTKAWSFSKYNKKYDPDWRERNFPNENFFGKINLFR